MINIKQINNGFADYYYLLEDGRVYNKDNDTYLNKNKNSYKLKTVNGKFETINLKKLYLLVFDKVFCIDNIDNLDCEEWRMIPETQGNYYCSNRGRIKSYVGYNAILLNPYKTKDGYLRVSLYFNKKRKDLLLHRIVAMCFLPAPPRIDYQLHHIDFNPSNCELSNIVWVSPEAHQNYHNKKGE